MAAQQQATGRLLLTTGNKSEFAVGYSTLYGDMCGGLAVLSDVPKTVVYELAAHVNRDAGAPRPDQHDHQAAERRAARRTRPTRTRCRPTRCSTSSSSAGWRIIESVETIVAATGFDAGLVRAMTRRIDLNEYKRRQMPPGIRVTHKAFGTGRRFPLAAKH